MLSLIGARFLSPPGRAFSAAALLVAVCLVVVTLPNAAFATAPATSPADAIVMGAAAPAGEDAGTLEGAPARSCNLSPGLCWTLPARPPHSMAHRQNDRPHSAPARSARHKWVAAPPDQPPRAVV